MSTKTLTMNRIALILAGGLLASIALADPTPAIDFSKIKVRPAVTNDVAGESVPPAARQDFSKRYDASVALLRKRDYATAKPLCEDAIKALAPYRSLLVEFREMYARELACDKAHYEEAIRVYDDLVAMNCVPAPRLVVYLNAKRNLLEKLGRRGEANKAALKALELGGLPQETRDQLKHAIISNLFSLKEYELGVKLAQDVIADPSTTPSYRVGLSHLASYNAERMMQKPDLGYDIIMSVKDVPLEKKNQWQSLERGYRLANEYTRNKTHGLQFDKALWALKRVYEDETLDMEIRYRMAKAVIDTRIDIKGDKEPLATIPVVLDFVQKNETKLTDVQRFTLLQRVMDVYDKHAPDKPEALAFAERIYNDPKAPYANRIKAIYVIAKAYRKTGDKAAEEAIYRKGLEIAKESPKTLVELLEKIAELRFIHNDPDEMIAVYNEGLTFNDSDEMKDLVVLKTADVYKKFDQFEKAVEWYLEHGKKSNAASLCDSWDYQDEKLAKKLFQEILTDPKAPERDRANAYEHLYDGGEIAKKYFETYVKTRGSRQQVFWFFTKMLTHHDYAYYAAYDKLITTYELFVPYIRENPKMNLNGRIYKYVAFAYTYKGEIAKAVEAIKDGLSNKDVQLKPEERYALEMLADLLPRKGDVKSLRQACAAADKRFAGEVPLKERANQLDVVGSVANMGRMENHVRALSAYKDSLYVPTPRLSYTVEYSETPVVNLANWDRLAKKPAEATMERHYGGGMEFLETDVATGDRGQGIGSEKGKKNDRKHPSFSAVCDAEGLHLRYFLPTDKAKEIQRGLENGGLFEGYIAPGEGQPYICLLQETKTGRLDLYNTAYTSANHNRVTEKDTKFHRAQTIFTKEGVYNYIFFSWKAYATLIPENGTVWDFENILWSNTGDECWNGTESIHGRSTWGKLVFNLPEKGRIEILRNLLFSAKDDYKSELRSSWGDRPGVFDYWKDKDLGDPAFYEESLKPIVEKLDGYAKEVTAEMTDADVLRLADEALPAWENVRFTVDRLREQYLLRKMMEEPAK